MFMHHLFSPFKKVIGSRLPDLQDTFVPNFIFSKLPSSCASGHNKEKIGDVSLDAKAIWSPGRRSKGCGSHRRQN